MTARRWRPLAALATLLPALFAAIPAAAAPAALAAPAAPAAQSRIAIILLDTNGSRSPARLPAEVAEARAYVRALPPDVRVGLVVFANTWRTALAPTANRALLGTALSAVRPAGGVSNGIGGALLDAMREISDAGARSSRLLVLSNAESLSAPVPAVSVPVDAVPSYYDADDFPGVLRQLVTGSGGRVAAAGGVSALAAAFAPLRPSAGSQSAGAASGASLASGWRLTGSLGIVLALVFTALLLLALVALRSLRPADRRSRLASQIGRYGPSAGAGTVAAPDAPGKAATTALSLMTRMLSVRNAEPRLARRLDQAGTTRQPAEWALLGACLSVAIAAALTLLSGNVAIGVLLGSLAGWAIMRLVLSFRISRRRAAFDDQLPGVLQLIAGSIQSGFSLAQSLDAVVREDAQPASGEFARALAENRLGVDLPDALDNVANRLQSTDLHWVIMAIRIQRETGGNLAEVLRNTVATMRERGYLRRQVRTLSAEGRLSAYVLLALPVLIGGWMFYTDSAYMRPLYATFYGIAMLIGAFVGVVAGAIWMRGLINVEV